MPGCVCQPTEPVNSGGVQHSFQCFTTSGQYPSTYLLALTSTSAFRDWQEILPPSPAQSLGHQMLPLVLEHTAFKLIVRIPMHEGL